VKFIWLNLDTNFLENVLDWCFFTCSLLSVSGNRSRASRVFLY